MAVTGATLRAALSAIPGALAGNRPWSLDDLARGADDAMRQAGITTRQGAAVFIAQCLVESAYFRTTTEYLGAPGTDAWRNQKRYAPYYGRGFIQVTWRDNYSRFGQWCKARGLIADANLFVDHPARLADTRWAWLTAVWYLTQHRHGLIALANAGDNHKVGRAINRGDAYSRYPSNGEAHRDLAYRALLNAGITAPTPTPTGDEIDMADIKDLEASIRRIVREEVAKVAPAVWGQRFPLSDADRRALRSAPELEDISAGGLLKTGVRLQARQTTSEAVLKEVRE